LRTGRRPKPRHIERRTWDCKIGIQVSLQVI